MFYAHSEGTDRARWQPLKDHLQTVAQLAGERGNGFGAARAAALAGWLHDLGKYAEKFQSRLEGSDERVDHATAGAKELLGLPLEGFDKLVAQLVSYAVAGHHTGLPDRQSGTGQGGSLDARVAGFLEPLDPSWRSEVKLETSDLLPKDFSWSPDVGRRASQLAFLGRMLFACLVDADYRDTESFYAEAEGRKIDRDWPKLPEIIGGLIASFDGYMIEKFAAAPPTPVNRLRADILAHVRKKAALAPGIFTLDVPTGGGKTLASLAFALDHAKAHDMRRIVTAIPFTSVIDQTATIFRDVLGDGSILEHHSAIEEEKLDKLDRKGELEGKRKLRLAMEDWAAPIIVTTNVQLFESLFSAKPSRCRKLHSLTKAVIVLDEAQTIPLPVLRPCVAALDELVRNYGCSIVLCTATQPALGAPNFKGGFELSPERELAPNPPALSPCRLIATSLVEAGVDVDFPAVFRAEAGLDQIMQAAGRCNREGKRKVEESIVTVFRPAEAKPPPEIAGFIGDRERILEQHRENLLSPAAILDCFGEVYWRKGDELDKHRVAQAFIMSSRSETVFSYRTIGEAFRLIESGLVPVIIAQRPKARAALEALEQDKLAPGAAARRLQSFIVQVPPKARQQPVDNGHVAFVAGFGDQFAVLRTNTLYTRDTGLIWENADYLGLESNVI